MRFMKKIVCLLFFLVSFFDVLWAQEGTYVVTRKAGEIPVYNSDNEVIGILKRGDRVFVTLFHKELPQVDGSYSEPVTFIEYEGQEGHLLLGSADWLKCEEPFVVDPETRAENEAAQARPGGSLRCWYWPMFCYCFWWHTRSIYLHGRFGIACGTAMWRCCSGCWRWLCLRLRAMVSIGWPIRFGSVAGNTLAFGECWVDYWYCCWLFL